MNPILIVSATINEAAPVIESIAGMSAYPQLYTGTLSGRPVEILISGIGTVATTFRLTRLLSQRTYDLALSMGIAGTFTDDISIGEVVQISKDCFADLGIDNNGKFLPLHEAGLNDANEFPFRDNWIINPAPIHSSYRKVRGITAQTTSGSIQIINSLTDRYHPQIETMENAAFFYVCSLMKIPFASFRAISNRVEPRNRNNWQIPQAIEQINKAIFNIIENGELTIENGHT